MNYTAIRFRRGKTIGKPVDKQDVSKYLRWRSRIAPYIGLCKTVTRAKNKMALYRRIKR